MSGTTYAPPYVKDYANWRAFASSPKRFDAQGKRGVH